MNNAPLRELQTAFQEHLLNLPSDIAREVAQGSGLDVDHRLHIYHNAYRMRLLECLQDSFEKTWAYLGDDTFERTALRFIEATPSQQRNLRWYGAGFPAWLTAEFPDDGDIAELAAIDWQLRGAFDGPDAAPLAAEELAALAAEDWESVGFRFVPTLCLLPIGYNTVTIWHALDQEQVPPTVEALPESAWLLIWRKGWQPHFRTITAIEHAALSKLLEGESFAAACAGLAEQFSDEDAAAIAAGSLGIWLQDEMIAGLTNPGR